MVALHLVRGRELELIWAHRTVGGLAAILATIDVSFAARHVVVELGVVREVFAVEVGALLVDQSVSAFCFVADDSRARTSKTRWMKVFFTLLLS